VVSFTADDHIVFSEQNYIDAEQPGSLVRERFAINP
jgi:hypothetical protein